MPVILVKSAKVIDNDILGWSLSLDGQWVSAEMTIPVRTVSTDEEVYDDEKNQLGLDNISELILYPALYGSDTIYILVKVMHTGQYRYEATQQKWQSSTTAYYYVFNSEYFNSIKESENSTNVIKIPLRDYGSLGTVKSKQIPDALRRNLVIKPKTEQILVATIKFDPEIDDKIYFQLSSQHIIFPEVEGVVKDFTINGRSLYGSPLLMNYLHYEYDKKSFYSFFDAQ